MRVTSYQGRGSSVRGVTAQWNSPSKERGYISQSTLDYVQQEKGFYQSEHIGIVQATSSYVNSQSVEKVCGEVSGFRGKTPVLSDCALVSP